ncbi:MAG TPA: type II and III secretion system protein [Tepidisphaeraceae bacterium]|jgi:type II secretory pathway component GspD/PulD (secretin)|nr:type II and III secretion system protein [Tepidisphaeraceae bacterium]
MDRGGRAAGLAGVLLSVLLMTVGGGCVEKVSETTKFSENRDFGNRPVVISGSPKGDAAAFNASEEKLTEVRYGVLEKKGPKGSWEGWFDHKKADEAIKEERVARGHEKPGPATTQPIEELPVKVVELPDGKVRLIWALRSYGGSNVTTTRDINTARRTVAAAPPDLTPLVAVLTSHVGAAGTVMPLPRENTIVVTCDKAMKPSVLDVLSKLDIPPRQVEIAAKIFEVSQDFDYQQGAQMIANRLAADSTQTASSVFSTQRFLDQMAQPGNAPFQGGVISLMKTFQEAGISVDASFQILADVGLIRVVSSPRMTVAAGQTGYMLAGQELPIQTASIINGVLQIATTYKPVGVQLYITPQAIGADRVKLHAISIVSSVAGFNVMPKISGQNPNQVLINPVIESREAETAVTIDDGATLVISGLRMSRTTTRENKVPGLGDIPILGWLFKNHRSQQQLTDLYFFVTPTML